MAIAVTALAVTPVKGTRIQRVERIELERSGARGNRRFFVIDRRGRMVNAKLLGELQTVVAECSDDRLCLRFPDGRVVQGEVVEREPVTARFFSRSVDGLVLDGPWTDALSSHVGQPVRLVEAEGSVDRGSDGAVSLISRASLARLADVAGESGVDGRRFRMLVEIDGIAAHEEDQWVGRSARVGDAVVRFGGHVGRCLITSRDPDTGVIDLPTLDILGRYRGELKATEPLPFGIYGRVLEPGAVRVGDVVTLGDG